jgi:hypothetical protein
MSTSGKGQGSDLEYGLLEGLIEALANKHSELTLNFEHTSLGIPSLHTAVEVNGTVRLSVHMRELTETERQALAQRNISMATIQR